jgi:hypothetical protein
MKNWKRSKCGESSPPWTKNTPIDIGSDGGERVPKLTLGDCARLAAREFPELFSGKKENALRELVSMRNKLGHFGTEALAWRDLEVFLRQVKLCSEVMISSNFKIGLNDVATTLERLNVV